MKLSTRGRYGTRALLDLALHADEGLVPVKGIAERQGISAAYLARVIGVLVRAGLVASTRGPSGGVSLPRPAREIRLIEVIQTLEGSLAPVECVDDPRLCPRSGFCVTRDVWGELKDAMKGVLEAMTLQDLVDRHREKERRGSGMYSI